MFCSGAGWHRELNFDSGKEQLGPLCSKSLLPLLIFGRDIVQYKGEETPYDELRGPTYPLLSLPLAPLWLA